MCRNDPTCIWNRFPRPRFASLTLTTKQLVSGCVILSMFFPCIATIVVLFRELGWKDALKSSLIMLAAVIVTGTVINVVWPS